MAGEIAKEAPLAIRQEAYPVVVLSHGTGGTAAGLAWLAQRLARNGFFVIGVDHHGNTATEAYRAEGFLCWWERARDLTVLLDHHATGPFARRIDLGRVYAAGFSLGGYTVLSLLGAITEMPLFVNWASDKPWGNGPREFPNLGELIPTLLESNPVFRASWDRQSASYMDTRIKGGLLCAPAPTVRGLTIDSLMKIDVPVSIAAVGKDLEAPSDLCAEWVHQNLPNSTFTLLDPGAGHYVFLCECTDWGKAHEAEICRDAPGGRSPFDT
ncbi:alpha/beta hydrolase [Ensifer sp. IC4062]|nr:alpha/beta hydrolase [Ensifer sp. IC4062]